MLTNWECEARVYTKL